MNIMSLVKGFLVIGIVACLQIVKNLLTKKGIKFKDEDSWTWIVLALGLPMAFIAQGIDGFKNFNVFQFITNVFLYAAAASYAYKTYKVGGKRVKRLVGSDKNGLA